MLARHTFRVLLLALTASCSGTADSGGTRDAMVNGADGRVTDAAYSDTEATADAGSGDGEVSPDAHALDAAYLDSEVTDSEMAADSGANFADYTCTDTLAAGGNLQSFVDSLSRGDVGCLEAGTHSVGDLAFRNAGVTLASVPGERATIELDYAHIDSGATDVTLMRLELATSGAHTIRIFGDRATLELCSFTNNNADGAGACVGVGGSNGAPDGVVLRGNRFHNCGGTASNLNHGIYANAYTNLTIEDNIFWRSGAYAIQLYPDAQGTMVRHNVIDGSKEFSVRGSLVIDGSSNNHTIEHNVLAYTATTAIQARTGSGHSAHGNCFWQNDGDDISGNISQSGNVSADPGFANRATGDLRLAPNSGCLAAVQYDTAAKLEARW